MTFVHHLSSGTLNITINSDSFRSPVAKLLYVHTENSVLYDAHFDFDTLLHGSYSDQVQQAINILNRPPTATYFHSHEPVMRFTIGPDRVYPPYIQICFCAVKQQTNRKVTEPEDTKESIDSSINDESDISGQLMVMRKRARYTPARVVRSINGKKFIMSVDRNVNMSLDANVCEFTSAYLSCTIEMARVFTLGGRSNKSAIKRTIQDIDRILTATINMRSQLVDKLKNSE